MVKVLQKLGNGDVQELEAWQDGMSTEDEYIRYFADNERVCVEYDDAINDYVKVFIDSDGNEHRVCEGDWLLFLNVDRANDDTIENIDIVVVKDAYFKDKFQIIGG